MEQTGVRPTGAGRVWAWTVVALLAAALAWREDTSLDLGTLLATGRYLLAHHSFPTTGTWYYTSGNHPYVDLEWLFEILAAGLQGLGGFAALGALRLVLVLGTLGLIFAHAARRGVDSPLVLLAGAGLGVLAWESRFFARPEQFTCLFVALELYLLRRHSESGDEKWLWATVPLQILWVNIHPLAILGPGLLILYAVSTIFGTRGPGRAPWIALAACIAALFASPFGYKGLGPLLHLGGGLQGGKIFGESISDLASPWDPSNIPMLPLVLFKALFFATLAAVALRVRSMRPFDLMVTAAFAVLGTLALRYTGLFVVATLPIFLDAVHGLLAGWNSRARQRRPAGGRDAAPAHASRAGTGNSAGLILAGAAALFVASQVLTGQYYLSDHRYQRFGFRESDAAYPIATVDTLLAGDLHGPIFHYLGAGGYLLEHVWPKEKIFLDFRMDDPKVNYDEAAALDGPGWDAMLNKYVPNLVLIPDDRIDVITRTNADSAWALVECDGAAALFMRRGPLTSDLEARFGAKWDALAREGKTAPPIQPRPETPFLGPLLRPHYIPRITAGRANALYEMNRLDAARAEYRRALIEAGHDEIQLVRNYADVNASLARYDEARIWYHRLLELDPSDDNTRQRLQYLDAGRAAP